MGMSMRFEFATASRILFGSDTIKDAIPVIAEMGQTVLLITGKNSDRAKPFRENLIRKGIRVIDFTVCAEPTVEVVNEGTGLARKNRCDVVIGIGGGSVIDASKAISVMMTNPGNLSDYLEVIGEGESLRHASAPCVAVPTTAGTGSEVTRNAVIQSTRYRVKVSLRSPMLFPRLVVVDPVLTCSMPGLVTAGTGMDALTQLIEPFVSRKANPMTDALCREGAREDMALSSLLSGIALTNAGLGAVHGLAGVLGGMFPIPHGILCGRLLSFVMEANFQAIQERMSGSPVLERFAEIARILTGNPSAKAGDGVEWIRKLCVDLNIPGLSSFGLEEGHFNPVIEKARQASSMRGNPIDLTDREFLDCLEKAL
jgi:alcohol dehydrogenase class IV